MNTTIIETASAICEKGSKIDQGASSAHSQTRDVGHSTIIQDARTSQLQREHDPHTRSTIPQPAVTMYRIEIPALRAIANRTVSVRAPAPAIAANTPLDDSYVIAAVMEHQYRSIGYDNGLVTAAELADSALRQYVVVSIHAAHRYPGCHTNPGWYGRIEDNDDAGKQAL